MKKIFSIFFLVLLFNSITNAANNKITLSGRITDKATGKPVSFVAVNFPDLYVGVNSNDSGFYKIDNLPNTKVVVQVRFIGYKTIIETIDLTQTKTHDFVLEESVKEMREVVITGSSHATELARNPVPMAVVSQQYLAQNNSTNIIDAIAKIPGVNAVTTGPNVSKPFIHGLGYNRVLTLYDGQRQEGQQWGDEHGIEIDENLIDRIEVVKGPASLIYGSDALAGVVNLLPQNPVAKGTIKGNVETNYQSNNGLYGSSANVAGNLNDYIFNVRVSHKQATNYQDKYDGRVYNTAFNETDVSGNVGVNKSWGYSHLTLSMFNDLQEIPDGSRDSASRKFTKQITEADSVRQIVSNSELNSYKITPLHQHVQYYRAFLQNNFIIGQSRLAVNLGFAKSIRQEFSHPQMPDIAGLYLQMQTATYDIKFSLPEKNGWESMLGVNGMYQLNSTDNATEFVIPDYHTFDFGPFAYLKKSLKKLDFSGGARFDVRAFQNESMYTNTNPTTGFDKLVIGADTSAAGASHQFNYYKHTFSGFSGSVGMAYNINRNFCLKANVARGFRAPNIAEISANGIHPGTGFDQLGNGNFVPEFSLQEDLGLFFQNHHISASVEIFNNEISNYIFDEKLQRSKGGDSSVIQGSNTFPVFKFEQTKAHLYGGEMDVDIHPHPLDWLHFENSISIVYAINQGGNGAVINDSNKYLPFIPPIHTNSELRAEFKKKFTHFKNIFAKVGVQIYAAQNRAFLAYNTETKTAGYTLLDAGFGATYTNKKGEPIFNISIFGTNLGDVDYQSNMSRLKYMDNYPVNFTGRSGIYNMGRNISLKLSVPLEIKSNKHS